jgi:hypothetical protein
MARRGDRPLEQWSDYKSRKLLENDYEEGRDGHWIELKARYEDIPRFNRNRPLFQKKQSRVENHNGAVKVRRKSLVCSDLSLLMHYFLTESKKTIDYRQFIHFCTRQGIIYLASKYNHNYDEIRVELQSYRRQSVIYPDSLGAGLASIIKRWDGFAPQTREASIFFNSKNHMMHFYIKRKDNPSRIEVIFWDPNKTNIFRKLTFSSQSELRHLKVSDLMDKWYSELAKCGPNDLIFLTDNSIYSSYLRFSDGRDDRITVNLQNHPHLTPVDLLCHPGNMLLLFERNQDIMAILNFSTCEDETDRLLDQVFTHNEEAKISIIVGILESDALLESVFQHIKTTKQRQALLQACQRHPEIFLATFNIIKDWNEIASYDANAALIQLVTPPSRQSKPRLVEFLDSWASFTDKVIRATDASLYLASRLNSRENRDNFLKLIAKSAELIDKFCKIVKDWDEAMPYRRQFLKQLTESRFDVDTHYDWKTDKVTYNRVSYLDRIREQDNDIAEWLGVREQREVPSSCSVC